MEMCYDGALVMPSSYAVMSEEEMTYVEGGNGWYNSRRFIGTVIDVAITIFTAGQAISGIYAMRKFIKANRKKMLRKVEKAILKYVGKISTNVISCAFNVAMTVAGTSIGGLIAAGLDYVDGKYNGYVFG